MVKYAMICKYQIIYSNYITTKTVKFKLSCFHVAKFNQSTFCSGFLLRERNLVPPAALVVFVRGKLNRISFNSIIFVIFCMAIYAALFHFFCIYLRIRIQQAITSFIFLRFVWLLNIQKNNINIYSINFKDFTLEMSLCTSKQDPYSFLQQSRVCLVL